MKTLIELYDEEAVHNVLATEVFQPETTIMLCPASVNKTKRDSLMKYFKARKCKANLVFAKVNMLDANAIAEKLKEILSRYEDCAVDIAGGTDASLFAAGSVCSKLHVPAFTYSRRRNTFFEIQGAPYAQALQCDIHLRVSDSFLMAGGTMLSGRMNNRKLKGIKEMIDPFFSVYEEYRREWQGIITYIQKISQSAGDLHAEGPSEVHGVRNTRIHANLPALEKFEQIGLIRDLKTGGDTVSFSFHSDIARFALRDVGSVLEMYIWKACMDTGVFDDVCLSAVVNWEDEEVRSDSVTNEIDVVCTRGVIPLFISCKTSAIKTEALNELAILRDRFGAPVARALIVTSSASSHDRAAMRRRASELDIAVIDQKDLKHDILLERLISLSQMRDQIR